MKAQVGAIIAPSTVRGALLGPKPRMSFLSFFLFFFFFFWFKREGKWGRKRRRETSTSCLPQVPQPGTEPETQAWGLTGNWTGDLSVCRTTLNQRSHTSQGSPELSTPSSKSFQYSHYSSSKNIVPLPSWTPFLLLAKKANACVASGRISNTLTCISDWRWEGKKHF